MPQGSTWGSQCRAQAETAAGLGTVSSLGLVHRVLLGSKARAGWVNSNQNCGALKSSMGVSSKKHAREGPGEEGHWATRAAGKATSETCICLWLWRLLSRTWKDFNETENPTHLRRRGWGGQRGESQEQGDSFPLPDLQKTVIDLLINEYLPRIPPPP